MKMFNESKQSAFSIIELLVVITIIASLTGLAIPAIRMMQQSYNSTGTENMISTALSNARSIAMSRQRYAGVRFQKAYNPDYPDDPLKQDQYMVFVVHQFYDTSHNLVAWFHAVEGQKPIKLPEAVGVMDMTYITGNTDIDDKVDLIDATAFSIIFSPSGKLLTREVRICNIDCYRDIPSMSGDISNDMVFNKQDKVQAGVAMFIQDDYPSDGLESESSRKGFVIYDRKTFAEYFKNGDAYLKYLKNLKDNESIYINAYTGAIIEK